MKVGRQGSPSTEGRAGGCFSVAPCFPQCGPWTSTVSLTCKSVNIAKPPSRLQVALNPRHAGIGWDQLGFRALPDDSDAHLSLRASVLGE